MTVINEILTVGVPTNICIANGRWAQDTLGTYIGLYVSVRYLMKLISGKSTCLINYQIYMENILSLIYSKWIIYQCGTPLANILIYNARWRKFSNIVK